MAIENPTGYEFSYNGVVFGPYTKTKVVEEPVSSGDGRTVKWSKITITVSGYVTQKDTDAFGAAVGGTLDAFMRDLRLKLNVRGATLKYMTKGYGLDLTINDGYGGGVRDVAFGPIPGNFTWWPLGGAPDGCHGAGFEWEVSTCIAECENFNIAPGVFSEVYFTVTYDTDEAGLVTITTSGTAQIPMSLFNDRLDFTIDSQIGAIVKPCPVGFMRRTNRQLSTDRASCSFTITDRQLEVPYPNNTVAIEMRYKVSQTSGAVGIPLPIWNCRISGTLRMSPTADRRMAWVRFFNLAAQRMAFVRFICANANAILPGPQIPGGLGPNQRPGFIVLSSELEEDLFKNESRFSMGFKVAGCSLRQIIGVSGLWQPIVNNTNFLPPVADADAANSTVNAEKHNLSLKNNAQQWGGLIKARFGEDADSDVIIDVCAGVSSATIRQRGVGNSSEDTLAPPSGPVVDSANMATLDMMMGYGPNDLVPPEGTWLAWSGSVRQVTNYRRARHKPLAGTSETLVPIVDPFGSAAAVAGNIAIPSPCWNATVPDIVQNIASPSLTVVLTGFAIRINYRIMPPEMISFGGVTPVLQHADVTEQNFGTSGLTNVFRTDWRLTYIIPSAPDTSPVLANPMLGTGGTGSGGGFQDPLQGGGGGGGFQNPLQG